ncbi:biotin/lipoyl-containing protein [Mesorhizobium sp. M0491]|uniref:biotin/lipoyl-containing protein n=1 Tax=Mesorhizobium sp. M0491 TaxID=2956950 RepID=UPI003335B91A
MQYIKVDETLWASSMLPEGILEQWFIASGDTIKAGDRIAEIRVEGALHEIVAPAGGRATIVATTNARHRTRLDPGDSGFAIIVKA